MLPADRVLPHQSFRMTHPHTTGPLELKLDLTANTAHQLFLEASSLWPKTANHSGCNACLTLHPLSHLKHSFPSWSCLPTPTLKKMKHTRWNKMEQIMLPVSLFSKFSELNLRTKALKIKRNVDIYNMCPKPRHSLS